MSSTKSNNPTKLNIVNFEKLKGMSYPTTNVKTYSWMLKVIDTFTTREAYKLIIEIGIDSMTQMMVTILREPDPDGLYAKPSGIYQMKIETTNLYKSDVFFLKLDTFDTPTKFLKKLNEIASYNLSTGLPF
jgi:hypothetical protein